MEHTEGYFKGPRNHQLYYQAWQPDHQPKAVLLIVHGMGEHCGRYMNLVDYFIPKGYALYGFDHIGHGRSEGKREFIESFDDYIQPLGIFHSMVKSWQPAIPVFIVGHSMGGTISVEYLKTSQKDFQGAIFSSPALKPYDPVSPVFVTIGRILSRFLPLVGILPIQPEAISRDKNVVEEYYKDPLVYRKKTTARLAAEVYDAMLRIEKTATQLHLPFLMVQGGSDTIVHPSGAQMVYDKAESPDKTIKVYDDLFHEVFNEIEKEQVLTDVDSWLQSHLP